MDDGFERLCTQLRAGLAARREAIAQEIAQHPRPITACDVHFNRLLEERARLAEALERFDEFVAFVTTA